MAAEIAAAAKGKEPEATPAPPATRKSPVPWIGVVAGMIAVVFLWTKNRPDDPPQPEATTVSVEPASPAPKVAEPPPPEPAAPAPSATTDPETAVDSDPPAQRDPEPAPKSPPPATAQPTASQTAAAQTAAPAAAPAQEPTEAQEEPRAEDVAAASPTRTVLIKAFPPGARIGHLGKEIGKDTAEIQLAEGERKVLEIGLDGHAARRLVVDGSEPEVTVILKPSSPSPAPRSSGTAAPSTP